MVKSNKLFKVLAIVLAIICIVSIAGVVNAAGGTITPEGGTITPESIKANQSAVDTSKISSVGGSIYGAIQAVGIAAGVVIIAYMGIKYITSSPDGKAEIKKQAYVYILGAAFLMLAPTVAKLAFDLVGTSSSGS